MKKIPDLVKIIVHWSLLVVTVIYLITGFGITEFRTIEAFSSGLLTKSLAFKVHNSLWIPFITLLVLHIFFALIRKIKKAGSK